MSARTSSDRKLRHTRRGRVLATAGTTLGALGLLTGVMQVATIVPATAATFTYNFVVNSNTDGTNSCGTSGGNCSLPDAIAKADGETGSGDSVGITFSSN